MHMQVIRDCLMDSPFACPGSAPIGGGKKGEFGDWSTTNYNLHLVRKYGRKSSANSRERRSKKAKSLLRGKNIASLFKTFDFSEFIIVLG